MSYQRDNQRRQQRLAHFQTEWERNVLPCFRWFLDPYGRIRGINTKAYDDPLCPLCAYGLVFEEFDRDPHKVAELCGLGDISVEVVAASDETTTSLLRTWLLRVTRLEEKS